MAPKTATNPYMPGGNPYSQAQDAGAATAPPMPDDVNDGPANPTVQPAPVTTVQPTTTRPRVMPNGQTAPMSTAMPGTGTNGADTVPAHENTTSMASLVPIICHACGQRGVAPLSKITSTAACGCGSDDLDLDFTVQGSWESDMPMDVVHDVDSVTQPARCSNCFQTVMVTATDPAEPPPTCPNCGADLLTPAGATMVAWRRTAAEPGEYGYEESDDDDRSGNKTCPLCGSKADEDGYCTEPGCPNQGKTVASRKLAYDWSPNPEGGMGTTLIAAINAARAEGDKIPGWFKRFFSRLLLPEELASGYFVHSEGGGSLEFAAAGPPKMRRDPLEDYREEDPYAAADREKRRQRRTEQERQWDAEGDERAKKLIPSHFKAKVEEITAGILKTNPSMPPAVARRVATETIQRYPKMLGSRG